MDDLVEQALDEFTVQPDLLRPSPALWQHRRDAVRCGNTGLVGLERRGRLDVLHTQPQGIDDLPVEGIDGVTNVRQAGAVFRGFHTKSP
ncbi:hypothetical protein D3C80_1662480 [compost metagenome]